MASTNANRRQLGRRRRRWIRLGIWTIALLWLGHYAYVRVTTPPAALSRQQHELAKADGLGDELLGLIEELPMAPPPTTQPATSGWWGVWSSSVLAAGLLGEWSPDPNSAQESATKYVSNPTTSKTLDRIVAVCAAREELLEDSKTLPRSLPTPLPGLPSAPRYEDAIASLTFRARYRTAEQADVAGALADLRAAARIATIQQQNRRAGMWWMEQSEVLVQYQLGCLAREVDLSPDLASKMIVYLTDKLSLSVADVVIASTSANMQVDRLLDRYYTDDGSGNGWLVLSAASEQMTLLYGTPGTERSRAWNVFSPLFSDRQTIRAKLLGLSDDLKQLDEMSYAEAGRFLADRQRSGRGGSVVDGPLFELTQGIDEYTFDQEFERVMRRRALVIMLALSACKQAHGAHPATLDLLVPELLPAVPRDALTNRPFQYTVLPDGDYDLSSDPGGEDDVSMIHTWRVPPDAYRSGSYVPQRAPKPDASQP
jgi:hypothetical protein